MAKNYVGLFESAEDFLKGLIDPSVTEGRGRIAKLVHTMYKAGYEDCVNAVRSHSPADIDCVELGWAATCYISGGMEALRKFAKPK
jgi:hypothetical protein